MSLKIPDPFDLLIEEIRQRSITCRPISNTVLIEANHGEKHYFLSQYTLPIIPRIYAHLLDDKKNFKALLRHHNMPFVLPSKSFENNELDLALAYVKNTIHFPVVCKPKQGMTMDRVLVGIHHEIDFITLWKTHYPLDTKTTVIVESFLPGASDYRFFCFRNHPSAVLCRHRPCLIGDGTSSITELAEKENTSRLTNPRNVLAPLEYQNNESQRTLRDQGFTANSIPNRGQLILLRYGSDVNAGGLFEVIDNTAVHPAYWDLIHEVWALCPNMPYFSLDILTNDITQAPTPESTAINESHVGANAACLLYPARGTPVNIFSHFVDRLFPETKVIYATQ